MTACVLCRRPCVPMADYDVPVCLHCDDLSDATIRDMLAGRETPRRGRGERTARFGLPAWAAKLPPSSSNGPGDPADIAELVALISAVDSNRSRREAA